MTNKTGRTGGRWWIDSRSEAYKDMTDVSRETVDALIGKYDAINKNNPSPEEKLEGAKLLLEIAEIYREESKTSTTPEIARQSIEIAKYLEGQAAKLRYNDGVNKYRMPSKDTVQNIAFNGEEIDSMIAATVNSDIQKTANDIVAAAIGDKDNGNPVQNWKTFVKLQSGKIDANTLEEIGEQYLAGRVDNPREVMNDAIQSSQLQYN
jgi:hypothetical protein